MVLHWPALVTSVGALLLTPAAAIAATLTPVPVELVGTSTQLDARERFQRSTSFECRQSFEQHQVTESPLEIGTDSTLTSASFSTSSPDGSFVLSAEVSAAILPEAILDENELEPHLGREGFFFVPVDTVFFADARADFRVEARLEVAVPSQAGMGVTPLVFLLGDDGAVDVRSEILGSTTHVESGAIGWYLAGDTLSLTLALPVAAEVDVGVTQSTGGCEEGPGPFPGCLIRFDVINPASTSGERTLEVLLPTDDALPARRFECSDGIDNDGDGRIDLDDRQCRFAADDSESHGGAR